ncbi:Modification methylase HaeIII [Peribacillus frigoritolerans]|uniref:DNA cytosine methyltransferase n=1 Tax=Peribacillus frigoritolerans TaxID=450367 RepID=UPI001D9674FB|nr:DNA cytosine methyltransferase [Peribacillus frigoritolerans]CAH0255658.1 Modification methylase HaeIII [Peribacillus frigoritolerans]
MNKKIKGISLFSGAGGMDIGFEKAGVEVIWANELDKDASKTYQLNNPHTLLRQGDIRELYPELKQFKDVDIVFGGPPCQGFSVAGKMDPNDERSTLVWTFLDVVKLVKPKAFVIENVKALGKLEKWQLVREKIYKLASEMGYSCNAYILNSANYGVPQKRERVFFVGFLNKNIEHEAFERRLTEQERHPKNIRETIAHLGPAGTENNPLTCTAKITFATNPIMRKSPYAGNVFNGMGRPLNLDEASNTLPASMGGNKTPIIDEEFLHGQAQENWVVNYHKGLYEGTIKPKFSSVPPTRLRRLTINEAALIQTFPEDYNFQGSKTSIYKQIGNAVPCLLAEAVAKAVLEELNNSPITSGESQLAFDDLVERNNDSVINSSEGFIDLKEGFIDLYEE